MIFRVYIAIESAGESHRYKAGDVRLVRPHTGNYGFIPLKNTLIALVESDEDLTLLSLKEAGKPKYNFNFPFDIIPDWIEGVDFDRVANPDDFYQPFLDARKAVHGHDGGITKYETNDLAIFSRAGGDLRTLTKKQKKRMFKNKVKGERKGRLLKEEDIDCGGNPHSEIILDASEQFAMIKNNATGKFKHEQRRNGQCLTPQE